MVFDFDAIVMTGSSCLDSTKPLTEPIMDLLRYMVS